MNNFSSASLLDAPARTTDLTHISEDGGDCYQVMGTSVRFLSVQPEFALVEIIAPPGAGVPLHVHEHEEETFFVQSGMMGATCGDVSTFVTAGETVSLPRHLPHAWKNIGDEPLRFLLIVSPGGFEQFFREIGTPVETGVPVEVGTPATETMPPTASDIEAMISCLEGYGVRFC